MLRRKTTVKGKGILKIFIKKQIKIHHGPKFSKISNASMYEQMYSLNNIKSSLPPKSQMFGKFKLRFK